MRAFFRSWVAVVSIWLVGTAVSLLLGLYGLALAYVLLGVALLIAERIEIRRTGRTISENIGMAIDKNSWIAWALLALFVATAGVLVAHFWAY